MVIDLTSDPSAVNQAVAGLCDHVALVVERNRPCIAAGARTVELLRHWGIGERSSSAVIVIRDSLASFMSHAEMESGLGCAIAAVIPPAAELCLASSRTGTPFALLEPENIATQSLIALTEKLMAPALISMSA